MLVNVFILWIIFGLIVYLIFDYNVKNADEKHRALINPQDAGGYFGLCLLIWPLMLMIIMYVLCGVIYEIYIKRFIRKIHCEFIAIGIKKKICNNGLGTLINYKQLTLVYKNNQLERKIGLTWKSGRHWIAMVDGNVYGKAYTKIGALIDLTNNLALFPQGDFLIFTDTLLMFMVDASLGRLYVSSLLSHKMEDVLNGHGPKECCGRISDGSQGKELF